MPRCKNPEQNHHRGYMEDNRIKELRKRTGMSQSTFAGYFGIPTRTIQKWERGGSVPPEYIPDMIGRILELEEMLGRHQLPGEGGKVL